ncbi:MAG: radical SAM protein, partial [Oligoflexia bacterium]|nr:radical SAM protein [Oligoflexia bacterium]
NSNEISNITKLLVEIIKIDEIRITGGEPSISNHLTSVVETIGKLKDIKKFALTSNGLMLSRYLPMLKANNCIHLNLSVDSLNTQKFQKITGGGDIKKIFILIEEASSLGFKIKINTVIMKNINEDEIIDFIHFSAKTGIEVRFLELIKMGGVKNSFNDHYFPMNINNIWKQIKSNNNLSSNFIINKINTPVDSTAINYLIKIDKDLVAKIGIIASRSHPFCNNCSRLRLDSYGNLRACLMSEKTINLHNVDAKDYPSIIEEISYTKPKIRPLETDYYMSDIGG